MIIGELKNRFSNGVFKIFNIKNNSLANKPKYLMKNENSTEFKVCQFEGVEKSKKSNFFINQTEDSLKPNEKNKFLSNQIIFEDNHILIINKRVGQLVQGDRTKDKSLLEEIAEFIGVRDDKHGKAFLGLVHRIDRPTSGLVIFAKTSKALLRLTEMLKKREIKKTYWAIVPKEMIPMEQKLVHHLRKNTEKNKSTAFDEPKENTKEARLSYKVIKTLDRYYHLEVDLETGRHHQIRSQLSKIGIPIKGDIKYGYPRPNPDAGISLHARKLEFIHPVTKEQMLITAPTNPKDKMWEVCL